MKVLIYTPFPSHRLHYVSSVLLGEVEISDDLPYFLSYEGAKLMYVSNPEDAQAVVPFSGWLADGKLDSIFPDSIAHVEQKTILPDTHYQSFDVFADAFFLLSRYEEYLPFKADYVGRFDVVNSVAAPATPVVDRWRVEIQNWLTSLFPQYKTKPRAYTASLTVDVDSAYAFRYKGLKRTLGGEAKDLVRRDFQNFLSRNKTLVFGKKDPFDTYETIEALAKKNQLDLTYFFLLGDFNAYDINLPHTSKGLKRLIQSSSTKAHIGIHPGVGSHTSIDQLKEEISRLKLITGSDVSISRQHYLKIHFPETYRRLLECGIRSDYTMGYSGDTRFRAGTSLPFVWYDLQKDEVTDLTIHPFAVMDATLKNYLRFNKAQSLERIGELRKSIEKYQGHFCLLWHNESVSDFGQWKDWSSIFPEALASISPSI